MGGFTIKVDSHELNRLVNSIGVFEAKKRLKLEGALKEGAVDIQRHAKQRVSRGGGKLRKSIKQKFNPRLLQAQVYSNLQYAHLVEFGAKAVTVYPKKKKMLKFPYMGQTIFRKVADIPERKPRPFLKPAYDYSEQHIIDKVKKALTENEKIT